MTERAKKYLFDILLSIEAIEEFLTGFDFIKYKDDLKTKSAVERQQLLNVNSANDIKA